MHAASAASPAGTAPLCNTKPKDAKPMQSAFIESFNGTFRDDCLNQHRFRSLAETHLLIEHWRSHDYNLIRPHSRIGRIPPDTFAFNYLNQITNNPNILNPATP